MKKLFLMTVAAAALLAGTAMSADLKFQPGQDSKFNWKSYDDFKAAHADLKGETLTIFGPWRGEDEALFTSVLNYFTEATGVNAKYSSSENYEQQIVIDTQAGSPPNVAILPQPGLLANLASKGYLTPLGDDVASWVKTNYGAGDSWVGYGTYKGKDARLYDTVKAVGMELCPDKQLNTEHVLKQGQRLASPRLSMPQMWLFMTCTGSAQPYCMP